MQHVTILIGILVNYAHTTKRPKGNQNVILEFLWRNKVALQRLWSKFEGPPHINWRWFNYSKTSLCRYSRDPWKISSYWVFETLRFCILAVWFCLPSMQSYQFQTQIKRNLSTISIYSILTFNNNNKYTYILFLISTQTCRLTSFNHLRQKLYTYYCSNQSFTALLTTVMISSQLVSLSWGANPQLLNSQLSRD